MGPIGFPETSVQNYHSAQRNIAPLAKYLSVTANLIEAELLRDTLYLFFGLWGQIFEAKSQSHFWSS
jgi:hypothetical protein